MKIFGAGKIIATPTNLADGTAITNPTPVVLGVLQDVSLDMSVDTKTLYGENKYPVAVAQGKSKLGITAKYAEISGAVLGSLFFGQAATNSIKDMALNVAGTIPGTPYQITPTVPSSGSYVADLGVFNVATGTQLTRVASAPATGQYSVNTTTGVYTFAAADTTNAVTMSFEYSASSSSAQLFTINNAVMGYTPSFSVMLRNSYNGKTLTAKFYRGVSGKFMLPMKNEDFTIADFTADLYANDSDQVGWICLQ